MQFAAAAPVSVAGCALAVVAAFVNWNWRYKAEDLAFDADAVQRRGQWYRAFTAPLAHSSLAHLVISVLGWTSAAGLVELTTGSVRMLLLTLVLLVSTESGRTPACRSRPRRHPGAAPPPPWLPRPLPPSPRSSPCCWEEGGGGSPSLRRKLLFGVLGGGSVPHEPVHTPRARWHARALAHEPLA